MADSRIGKWRTYQAYQNSEIVVETPNLVFGVYDGALLSYNPEDGEIVTYSFEEGLNDVNIKQMAYIPEEKALVLVYENANIDIFLGKNLVYNLSDKKDYSTSNKVINNLEVIDGNAYISTGFGIVVVDVKQRIIRNTYNPGYDVRSVTKKGDYFYAYTTGGIKKGPVTSNLLDKNNWTDVPLNYPIDLALSKNAFFFKDYLILVNDYSVFYLNLDGHSDQLWGGNIHYANIINDQLVLSMDNTTYFYSDFYNYSYLPFPTESIIPSAKQDTYWIAETGKGMMKIRKGNGSNEFSVEIPEITVNSPKRNLTFYMTCQNNRLYIVGGGRSANRLELPGTLMILENNRWVNLDEKAISEATGVECLDFMSIAIDPTDPDHYFVSSWGEGVYEFRNNEFVERYNYLNSSLESSNPNFYPDTYVRIDGLVYDADGNLWMTNTDVPDALHKMSPDGTWEKFSYEKISGLYTDLNRILISRNNEKWLNIWRGAKVGLFAIDRNGTGYYSSVFIDQNGKKVEATSYLCMAEDQNGTIWVGTDIGPINFSSATQVQNGTCSRIVSSDEYDGGFYLLENQKITTIAVDGGNRKWIGTTGGGVFVVDQSDPEKIQVENYTTKNSYLLSNNIRSIAINDLTGEVFIGTDQGLCSYMSEAIEGKPDYSNVYAFPNPVYLSRNNQVVVTGLMADSNVKITDLAGNLIKEGASMGGQFLWNCTDRFGATVKAGMYLVLAATPTGSEGVVTKIVVIK